MATTRTSTRHPPLRRQSSRSMPWMGERQLDAYLEARETLRRLRTAASHVPAAERNPPTPRVTDVESASPRLAAKPS